MAGDWCAKKNKKGLLLDPFAFNEGAARLLFDCVFRSKSFDNRLIGFDIGATD